MTEPSRAVLITGCSSGIGKATAEHLAGKGCVTSGARFILTARKLLPDRGFDAFLRVQYPRPKP